MPTILNQEATKYITDYKLNKKLKAPPRSHINHFGRGGGEIWLGKGREIKKVTQDAELEVLYVHKITALELRSKA